MVAYRLLPRLALQAVSADFFTLLSRVCLSSGQFPQMRVASVSRGHVYTSWALCMCQGAAECVLMLSAISASCTNPCMCCEGLTHCELEHFLPVHLGPCALHCPSAGLPGADSGRCCCGGGRCHCALHMANPFSSLVFRFLKAGVVVALGAIMTLCPAQGAAPPSTSPQLKPT